MATNADKAARATAGRDTGTEVVPRTAYEALKQNLELSNDAFLRALTGHAMTVEGFHQAVLNVTIQNPDILNCDPRSIVGAALICATTGLHPGPEGYAHIVPYNEKDMNGRWVKKAQFQFGYPGLLKLVYESKRVVHVLVEAVYDDDIFAYTLGTDPKIHHEPNPASIHDEAHMTHVYSVLFLRDSTRPSFRVMTKSEVDAIRATSKGAFDRDGHPKPSSPWFRHYVEMARKTVLRNHMKTEYLGDRFARQLDHDETTVDWDERVARRTGGDVTMAVEATNWETDEREAPPDPAPAAAKAEAPAPSPATEELATETLDDDDAASLAAMVKVAEQSLDAEVIDGEATEEVEEPAPKPEPKPEPEPVSQPQNSAPADSGDPVTEQVLKGLAMTLKNMGVPEAVEKEWLAAYGVTSKKELTKVQGLEMVKQAGRYHGK